MLDEAHIGHILGAFGFRHPIMMISPKILVLIGPPASVVPNPDDKRKAKGSATGPKLT